MTLFLAGKPGSRSPQLRRLLIFAGYINVSSRTSLGPKRNSNTMKENNGFSSSERARVGNIQLKAIRAGKLPRPTVCELCSTTEGQLQLHNEDYSKPFDDAHPICRACHMALHVRFTNPERWEKRKELIRSTRGPGDYWWEKLVNTTIDINPAHK